MTGRAGNRPPRRVAVTSPQTRVALGGRRGPPARAPRLASAELARAERIRTVQLRRAVTALLAGGAFLVGLPISWLAVAVLPWPVLTGLAWWQLRRAERAERAETDEDAP